MSGGAIVLVSALAVGSLLADQFAEQLDRTIDNNTAVFTSAATVNSPFAPNEPSAAFGIDLLEIDTGVVVVGNQGIAGATASVVSVPSTGAALLTDVVFAEQAVAAAGNTLVVVDARRLRMTTIDDQGLLNEVASYERPDDATFGRRADLGGSTLAVLRDAADGQPAVVEVFDLTAGIRPVVALVPGLERVSIAIGASGDLVAVSGVRNQDDVGEVQFFRRSGEVWLVDARFEAIGGGTVVAAPSEPDTFHVQRNGFFPQPTGTWTKISPDASGALLPSREWSVQASSVAVSDGLAAFGLPGNEQVLTFTFDAADLDDDGVERVSLRHAQSIVAPIPVPTDDTPMRRRPPASQFGTSVVFVNGRLVVAGPGAEIAGVVDEGSIFIFDPASGPAGCTITGTRGDDTLNGTTADDVICGLGGNDVIRGNLGFDRLYGGEGDDDLSGDAANDLLVGGNGADRLAGGAGDDTLFGGAGNDALFGGDGNDALDGGDGRDACDGGGDVDTFNDC